MTILVLLALSVQSIRFGDSHQISNHKVKYFVKDELVHRAVNYFDSRDEMLQKIHPEFLSDLIELSENYEDIMDSITNNKPVKQESTDKIKD